MANASLPSPTANTPQGVDARIIHPLDSLRGKIRLYVVLESLAHALTFLAAWFWVGLLLDYGLFALTGVDWVESTPRAVRAWVLGLVAVTFLALLLRNLLVRLLRDFTPKSLALVLERRFPCELGDRLITAIELADVERSVAVGYSREMIQKTIHDVRERVEQLPVSKVLNWYRLRVQYGVFLAVLLGGLVTVGLGYAMLFLSLHLQPANPETPRYTATKVARSLTNLAGMWVERNVLLETNLWPRRIHMEIVSIPADQDTVHLGPNRIPYTVKAQAFKWVMVDSAAPQGLRAMTWKDAATVLGDAQVPPIAIDRVRAVLATARQAELLSPAASFQLASTLEGEAQEYDGGAENWQLDRLEELLAESNLLTAVLKQQNPEVMGQVQGVLDLLAQRTEDPYSLRSFRRLSIPEKPELLLRSRKSRIDVPMKRVKKNLFLGDITKTDVNKLTNLFTLKVAVGDYTSPAKQVEMVPPPTIVSMKRTEYQPAYLHYFPLFDDTQKPLNSQPTKLRGLRQTVDDLFVSLTDRKCRFEVTQGTEVLLSVTLDKPLKSAAILVKNATRFPGADVAPDPQGVRKLPLEVAGDRKTVQFAFTRQNARVIQKLTDFEFEFTDDDDVSSTREVQIQPLEDALPDVDVVVDSLRKVGTSYLCTPKALIPFARESKITDSKGGLNRVEYRYSYAKLESGSDLAAKASFIGLIMHSSPQFPSLAHGVYRTGMLAALNQTLRSDSVATPEQAVLLTSFKEEWEKRTAGRLRLPQVLTPLLQQPLKDEAERDRLIQSFSFNTSGSNPEEGFDLERILPNLAGPNPEVQPNYLLTLSVAAVDSNVEAEEPRVGLNKEPLTFRVVSHLELLGEIAREQSDLAAKIREVIRRLERNQKDLFVVADRLRSPGFNPANRDEFIPEQTRLTEMAEGLTKSHDMTAEVHADYARILKELITNRFDRYRDKTIKTIRDDIVSPLQGAIKDEFPAAGESLAALQGRLNQAVMPDAAVLNDPQAKISNLLTLLRKILEKVEDTVQLDKLIDSIKELKKQQENIGGSIKEIAARILIEELAPVLTVPASLTLAPGEKKVLTIDLAWTIDQLSLPYSLTIQPAAESDMKLSTSRIEVKGTPLKLNVEVTAGTKKGEFPLRVVPSFGKGAELKVIVK